MNDVLLKSFSQINADEIDERFYEFVDNETLDEFLDNSKR